MAGSLPPDPRPRVAVPPVSIMRPNLAKAKMIDIVREVVPAAREVHILAA